MLVGAVIYDPDRPAPAEGRPGDVVFYQPALGPSPVLRLFVSDIASTRPIRWLPGYWTRIVQHNGTRWRLRANWAEVTDAVLAARGFLAQYQKIDPGSRVTDRW
jgi:hypothetical protein